jgi:nucleotide-binding universal stress UspA family protein
MQSVQNILIAVDLHHGDRLADNNLSPAADAAVQEALALAGNAKAAVTFCAVLEISEHAMELIREDVKNAFFTVEDYAKKALERLVAQAEQQGISASAVVRLGSSWDELLKQIDEGKHDLVVVGTRKRSGVARTLFGSTAQRLLRTAPCPVWIVKPDELREVREVLVATDLTDACQEALHAGVYVSRLLNAKLFVVHSLEFPFEAYLHAAGIAPEEIAKQRNKIRTEARQKLDAQLQKTDGRTLNFGVKTEILEGSPDDVLPKFIETNQIDLLVIGTHARQGLGRWMLGNTAERLLPLVHASVLTVRTL